MSAWTDKLIATYTLAQIQDQAKKFGIKNVKKFTKEGLALEIELTIEAANSLTDTDTDKTKEQDMNEITETTEVTPIVGNPEELIALLNGTAEATPEITADEVAGILEDTIEDSLTTETDTEAAPKLTPEFIAMLAEVKANAAKRKHPIWNALKDADDILMAQAVGKASTVRGMLWKLGKSIAPAIAAYDAAEAAQAEKAAAEEAALEAAADAIVAEITGNKMGE